MESVVVVIDIVIIGDRVVAGDDLVEDHIWLGKKELVHSWGGQRIL